MAHPVFVDRKHAQKGAARSLLAYWVPSAAFLRTTDMQGTLTVFVSGLSDWFVRRAGIGTPDDGLKCIHGPNGEKWVSQQELT